MKTEDETSNYKEKFNKEQAEVDELRRKTKISLVEEEKKKHEAVEKALALLAAEDIYAYIYADLPHQEFIPGIPCVYQFNTLGTLTKYDDKGNRTDESSYRNEFFNSALWCSLVDNTVAHSVESRRRGLDKLDRSDPDTYAKHMQFIHEFIHGCRVDYNKKRRELLDDDDSL